MNEKLPPLEEFILPGGSEFNARLHIARTTCRNSERSLVSLHLEHIKMKFMQNTLIGCQIIYFY